jgi:hypothetical protein
MDQNPLPGFAAAFALASILDRTLPAGLPLEPRITTQTLPQLEAEGKVIN